MRVASEHYADTVGDLLFALGAVEEPGMPTITQRMAKFLGRNLLFDLGTAMQLEAMGLGG